MMTSFNLSSQHPHSSSRLILGDCIDILNAQPENSIDLVVTDPPYLVNYRDRSGRILANDISDTWVHPAFTAIHRVLKPDTLMVCFYGWNKIHTFMESWLRLGLRPVGHFACIKRYASSKGLTARSHENAYLLAKGKPRLSGSVIPRDVLSMPYTGNVLHPTQKPIEVLTTFIESYSKPGDTILDPFAGSASTMIAAHSLARHCIAIEKDSHYFALARQRIQDQCT